MSAFSTVLAVFALGKGIVVAAPPCQIDTQGALAHCILGWFSGASGEEKGAMMQATYGLWLARNETRKGKRNDPPHAVMEVVHSHMLEWTNSHPPTVSAQAPKIIQR